MTVTSERWMERFIMNPQVLLLDGLAFSGLAILKIEVWMSAMKLACPDTYSGIRTTRSY